MRRSPELGVTPPFGGSARNFVRFRRARASGSLILGLETGFADCYNHRIGAPERESA